MTLTALVNRVQSCRKFSEGSQTSDPKFTAEKLLEQLKWDRSESVFKTSWYDGFQWHDSSKPLSAFVAAAIFSVL